MVSRQQCASQRKPLTKSTDDVKTNKAETPASPSPSSPITPRTLQSKTRPSRRTVNLAQSITLDPEDALGPLGPLGATAEEAPIPAPTPPVKELVSRTKAASRPSTSSSFPGDGGSATNGEQGQSTTAAGRQNQPSVSVEQAANPSFHISVGDPHTVGGATSSHTVYAVTTKTTSKAYNAPTFTVTRRYRDFLWLYEQLHSNNPGVVVPPPPEKQTMGRFDVEFIEHRRQALEKMINKIAAHPILHMDGDLKTFLESEAFNVDIKHKDRAKDPLASSESKGLMSTIGLGASSGSKFIEHDDWFHDRRVYLDALENQLKALQRSIDAVVAQRKSLAESCGEFSASLHTLAAVELSPSLSGPLDALGDLQIRIQELYHRQAMQDILTLGIVIEEYIRLIGSVKKAFEQRQKSFHAWHSAETKLLEIRKQQDKLLRAGRSQQDRIAQMSADVNDAERRVHQARLLFEDMGRLMRTELDRFEREKVDDFKSGVETFLESAVEAQKEVSPSAWYEWTATDESDSLSSYGRHTFYSLTVTKMDRLLCLQVFVSAPKQRQRMMNTTFRTAMPRTTQSPVLQTMKLHRALPARLLLRQLTNKQRKPKRTIDLPGQL